MSRTADQFLRVVRTALVGYLRALRTIDSEMASDLPPVIRGHLDTVLRTHFGVWDTVDIPSLDSSRRDALWESALQVLEFVRTLEDFLHQRLARRPSP